MLESTFLRLPHVGPDFLKIAFISGITVALAAFFAVTAMIWERFTEQGYTGAWPRRFDAAWQALAVLSLAAYLGFGVYGLATASPFTPERLDLTSNEHPFQRLSISFAALSVAVLPEWCRLVLILAITLIMGLLPILESMDPHTPRLCWHNSPTVFRPYVYCHSFLAGTPKHSTGYHAADPQHRASCFSYAARNKFSPETHKRFHS